MNRNRFAKGDLPNTYQICILIFEEANLLENRLIKFYFTLSLQRTTSMSIHFLISFLLLLILILSKLIYSLNLPNFISYPTPTVKASKNS